MLAVIFNAVFCPRQSQLSGDLQNLVKKLAPMLKIILLGDVVLGQKDDMGNVVIEPIKVELNIVHAIKSEKISLQGFYKVEDAVFFCGSLMPVVQHTFHPPSVRM